MDHKNQQLERIVAYLDGELSVEESAQVEQQLASDEQFRRELQGAQRAWTALDQLPMTQVGDEFSRTTMELVVDAAREDVEALTIALPVQKRKRNTKVFVLAAMAALLGILFVRVVAQNPNRRLVADLPVIQNVDIYSQLGTVDFLRQLQTQLGDDYETSAVDDAQLQDSVAQFELVASVDSREQWLESLSADEQVSLRAKLNRFGDLSDKKRRDLRELHEQLASDDDRQQLLETMYRYEQWLSDLQASDLYKLREMEASDRATRVARDMRRAARNQEFALTDEQLREMIQQMIPFIRKAMMKNRTAVERQFRSMSPEERRDFGTRPRPDQLRKIFQVVMQESPEDFIKLNEAVVQALPEDVSEAFQGLSPKQKVEQMRAWAWQFGESMKKQRRPGESNRRAKQISEEELADFFVEELDPAEKEKLLALPRDQMKQRLERMLRGRRSRSDWSEREWDGPPPGPSTWRRRDGEGRPPRRSRGDDWDGPGPPPRGERGGPPRFGDDPGRPPRFEGQRNRPPRREGPPRRRPDGPPPSEDDGPEA